MKVFLWNLINFNPAVAINEYATNVDISELYDGLKAEEATYTSFSQVLKAIDTHWYFILLIAFLISIVINFSAKAVFRIYSFKFSKRMLSGWEAAKAMLTLNCVYGVDVVNVSGELTDHYDVETNEIRLSESVYSNSSVAAIGIACHEAGHAIQYAYGSPGVKVRAAISGIFDLTWGAFALLILSGLIFGINALTYNFVILGIVSYGVSTLFKLLTLHVEFDASRKALESIERGNILEEEEIYMARKVLLACALTYVASTLMSILYLLKLIAVARKNR